MRLFKTNYYVLNGHTYYSVTGELPDGARWETRDDHNSWAHEGYVKNLKNKKNKDKKGK